MIKHIKDELTELLLKIGETNLNQSDLFTEEKPSLFLPEGRTIYLEGDYYYIVLKEIPTKEGLVAPWFDEPGMGIQYYTYLTIDELEKGNFLLKLK